MSDPFITPPLNRSTDDHGSILVSPSTSPEPSIHQPRLRFSQVTPDLSTTCMSTPSLSRSSSSYLNIHKRLTSTSSMSGFRQAYPSTRLKGEIYKPWLEKKDPAHRWARIIFWGIFAASWGVVAIICYLSYRSIPNVGNLCLVMQDDFAAGTLNSEYWSHEVRVDGYGNGQFEWTTASPNNTFIQDNTLYLVPTLTSDVIGGDAVVNGYTLNLTSSGLCTSSNTTQCVARSNASIGSVINPVQAARVVTRNKVSIKYGKVEVTARMPTGDWIWPALWMLPENSAYGEWPRSGEIDIVESRGNGPSYGDKGNDYVQSALHWGPVAVLDSYLKTWGIRTDKTKGFTNSFHKYTMEWNDRYLTTYIDNKVQTTMLINFDKPFWDRGNYPAFWVNGTETQRLTNPWFNSGNNAAPFDQPFYLIMNIAVGGTNGFFPDGMGGKPWQDSSSTAMADFWSARERWLPTWPTDPTKRGMAIKGVKMWQKC